MKRAALIAYLLAVHALLAALLWSPALSERLHFRATGEPEHVAEMREVLHWRDATTPRGAAVFLGDSLTERLAVGSVAPDAVNFAVSRSRTDQLFVPESVTTASHIYLLTGANDYLQGRQAGIVSRLQRIADTLPRDVPLVWTGIMLPEAAATNRAIESLCAARPKCAYVPPIRDPALFVDGVHLSPAGYAQWVKRLRQATP